MNFAKGLSYATGIPLVPVHHLRSHIAANYITNSELERRSSALSSRASQPYRAVNSYTDFTVIGRTRDDAAGECMDKSARAWGLITPALNLDRVSKDGDPTLYKLPHPHVDGGKYDFSFSGLKTAVVNVIHNAKQKG